MLNFEALPVDFWEGAVLVSSFVVPGSPKAEAKLELEKNPMEMASYKRL